MFLLGVSVCFEIDPYLKVSGMKHVLDDENFFMPFASFPGLLRPPVQLPEVINDKSVIHIYSNTQNMLIKQSIIAPCVRID